MNTRNKNCRKTRTRQCGKRKRQDLNPEETKKALKHLETISAYIRLPMLNSTSNERVKHSIDDRGDGVHLHFEINDDVKVETVIPHNVFVTYTYLGQDGKIKSVKTKGNRLNFKFSKGHRLFTSSRRFRLYSVKIEIYEQDKLLIDVSLDPDSYDQRYRTFSWAFIPSKDLIVLLPRFSNGVRVNKQRCIAVTYKSYKKRQDTRFVQTTKNGSSSYIPLFRDSNPTNTQVLLMCGI